MASVGEVEASVLFHEADASGRSLKNWVTKYGGATGCLRITVTENELLVAFSLSSLPAFSLLPQRLRLHQEQAISKQSDLDHRIPKARVTSVSVRPGWWKKTYRVDYVDVAGGTHCLELMPKQCDEFERALRLPIATV